MPALRPPLPVWPSKQGVWGLPPDVAQAQMERTGVPIVAITDEKAKVVDAIKNADVARVVICAPANVGVDLLDIDLIQRLGRRRVLRLPDRRATSALGHRALEDRSAHPFAPGVSLQDIDARIDEGAVVEVIDGSTSPDSLPLAAVSPQGTVNLQPGSHAPGPKDTVIALASPTRDGHPPPT